MAFHDFDEFEQLVQAAKETDSRAYLIALLGGEAGLRCGEIMALEWRDVNVAKNHLVIERSDWKGNVTATKGGRVRYVPLTNRLAAATTLSSPPAGSAGAMRRRRAGVNAKNGAGVRVQKAARRANLTNGGVAGHQDLATTQRYMHLSPAALDSAIRLLDRTFSATPAVRIWR